MHRPGLRPQYKVPRSTLVTESSRIALRSAAITDIGRVRRQNEDRFYRSDEAAFYAVADGIGGLPRGAAAAQSCIDALSDRFEHGVAHIDSAYIVRAIHAANSQVIELGKRISPQLGIGSTLVCASIQDDRLILAHVGDSRAYLIRDGLASPLTEDHTVANELKRTGSDSPIPLDLHQMGALTRCLGQPTPPEVDVAERTLCAGDLVFLASDGVSRILRDIELPKLLTTAGTLVERLANVIALVNERGAPDNATAILIAIESA